MKKFLAVLLAVAMIFTLATAAMAADTQAVGYSDITKDTPNAEAIYKLSALGVLEGYPDGSFKEGQTITRAEFAKLACYLFNVEDAYAYYGLQKSAFSDVTEGHWAEGYINCAFDNKLMIGVGYGQFAPNALVSMQEVATVVLRALGYVDFPGTWPNNYVMKAAQVKLVKLSAYAAAAPATRGQVADVFADGLDLEMVEKVPNDIALAIGYANNFDTDSDGYVYVDNVIDDTNEPGDRISLLSKAFGITAEEVIFFDNQGMYSEAAAWGYKDFEDGELSFLYWPAYALDANDDLIANPELWQPAKVDNSEAASEYWVAFGDVTDLGGQMAEVYINDDEEIFYVGFESTVTRFAPAAKADAWAGVAGKSYLGSLAKDAYGEIWYDADGDEYFAKDFEQFMQASYVVFKSLDDDWLKILVKDKEEKFDAQDIEDEVCDLLNDADGYVIYKDGAWVDFADLEKGDVLYIMPLAGADDVALLYVSPAKTGDLTKQYADTQEGYLLIDDAKYYAQYGGYAYNVWTGAAFGPTTVIDAKPSSFFAVGFGEVKPYVGAKLADDYFDEEVTYAQSYFFKDFVYISYDDSSSIAGYGIITDWDYAVYNTDNRVSEITIQTFDGEEVVLPVKKCSEAQNLSVSIDNGTLKKLEGALIEYKLNDDGELYYDGPAVYDVAGWSFNIRQNAAKADNELMNATTNDAFASYMAARTNPGVKVTVDDEDMEIRFTYDVASVATNSPWYEVVEDVEIFIVSRDADDDLIIDTLSYEDLFAGGNFECENCAVFYKSGDDIETLYIYDYDTAAVGLGFVTAAGLYYDGDKDAISIDGVEKPYKAADIKIYRGAAEITADKAAYMAGLKDKAAFVEYKVDAAGTIIEIRILADVVGTALTYDKAFTFDGDNYTMALMSPVADVESNDENIYGRTIDYLAAVIEAEAVIPYLDSVYTYDMVALDTLDAVTNVDAGDGILIVLNEKGKAAWVGLYRDVTASPVGVENISEM